MYVPPPKLNIYFPLKCSKHSQAPYVSSLIIKTSPKFGLSLVKSSTFNSFIYFFKSFEFLFFFSSALSMYSSTSFSESYSSGLGSGSGIVFEGYSSGLGIVSIIFKFKKLFFIKKTVLKFVF